MMMKYKNKLNNLKNLIENLQAFELPVLIKNMSRLTSSQKNYEEYRTALDSILKKIPEMNSYNDENFSRICCIFIGPFTQYSMETYYEIISERLKSKDIERTTEKFWEYIKKIP
jgi:hypothetical protein